MRVVSGLFLLSLVCGCTPMQLATDGQLFCSIAKSDGTSEVVSVINAVAPGAVIVTGIESSVVAAECPLAAAQVAGGVSGVPVPPATPAAVVAIVPPKQTPAPTAGG